MKAAEQDTSVSALVRRFLVELAAGENDAERLRREERAMRERIKSFTAGAAFPARICAGADAERDPGREVEGILVTNPFR